MRFRWSWLLLVPLILVAALALRPDPVTAVYTSVGSGRADGGATLTFRASGRLTSEGGPIEWRGRYASNATGYVTTLRPKHPLAVFMSAQPQTLIRYTTNSEEYLLSLSEYRPLLATGDTNRLVQCLKRVR